MRIDHKPRRARHARRIAEPLETRIAPAVFNVNSLADVLSPPAGTVTLRSAIRAANATAGPNTINLTLPGTYRITLAGSATDNSAGEFAVTGTSSLLINNTSGGAASIDGGGGNRVFDINPAASATAFAVTFQGVSIVNGSVPSGNGGGIDARGAASVVLNGVAVRGNTAGTGGGIALDGTSTGTLTLNSSLVANNKAVVIGGGIADGGAGTVAISSGSIVSGNSSGLGGGGVWISGAALSVRGATISGNVAGGGSGGGILNNGAGAVTIVGSIIRVNYAKTDGGGFGDAARAGRLTVTNSFVLGNAASGNGGGIQAGGPVTLIGYTTIRGNGASGSGGGLDFVPDAAGNTMAQVSNSVIVGNASSASGGGIEANVPIFTVATSTVSGNSAAGNGGGLDISSPNALVSVITSLFANNVASSAGTGNGGALYQSGGNLTVDSSQFTGNAAAQGGALFVVGVARSGNTSTQLRVDGCTFDSNRATSSGGALNLNLQNAFGVLTNDTINANLANANGGGLTYQGSGAPRLSLVNDTIDANVGVVRGGGLEQVSGVMSVLNTIISENASAGGIADVFYASGTLADAGGNLLSSTAGSGGKFGAGTIIADPALGPLLDNGGLRVGSPSAGQILRTQSLRLASPAIGTGVSPGAPGGDARGFSRPSAGRTAPSIGAFEPQFAANASVNQVFAENLYEVLLNRVGDPAGIAALTSRLNGGTSPISLVQIFLGSNEYLSDQAYNAYVRYLHRAPSSSAETANFVAFIRAGTTLDQAGAFLAASPEAFINDGNSNDSFIESVYQSTLGRTANATEVAGWAQALANGASRGAVTSLFVSSTGYLANLVQYDFLSYLGRAASSGDVNFAVSGLQGGLPTSTFKAEVLGSNESFRKRT